MILEGFNWQNEKKLGKISNFVFQCVAINIKVDYRFLFHNQIWLNLPKVYYHFSYVF